MPYGAKANEIQKAFERVIEPYMQPGNCIADDMYDNLELPWAADPAQTAFPKDKFRRFDWDRGGVLSDGKDFFGGSHEFSHRGVRAGARHGERGHAVARGAPGSGGHGARLLGGGA